MASNEFIRNLLIEQRKRLVSSLMEYSERNVYPKLNERERKDLREKVLASVGVYHDTCLDILKASINDGSIVNEMAIEAISNMHKDVMAALEGLNGAPG